MKGYSAWRSRCRTSILCPAYRPCPASRRSGFSGTAHQGCLWQRRVVANDGALEALEADCASAGWQEEHCEALDEVAPDGSAKITLSAWEKLRAFDRLPLSAFKPQLS